MDRRQFLQALVVPPAVVPVGCLNTAEEPADCTDAWSPSVEADEPTLAPGDETSLHLAVTDVTGLHFGRVPLGDGSLEMDVADASVSPSPDRTADSYPPKWYWSECSNVEVVVPVRVAEGADSREYGYAVHLLQSRDGSGETEERQFTVTVSGN